MKYAEPVLDVRTTLFVGLLILVLLSAACSEQTGPDKNDDIKHGFPLLVGGMVENGDFSPRLVPIVPSENFSWDRVEQLYEREQRRARGGESIFIIEVVESDGQSTEYPTTASYCPPRTDVCRKVMEEVPPGRYSFETRTVNITPETEVIRFFAGDELLHEMHKPQKVFTVGDLSYREEEVNWSVDTGTELYGILELYKNGEWHTRSMDLTEDTTSSLISPGSIRAADDYVDVRVAYTDGFRLDTATAEDLIAVPNRSVDVSLTLNYPGQRLEPNGTMTAGNALRASISFIDPLTGQGCDEEGCWGDNEGAYNISWYLNGERVPTSDLYSGLRHRPEEPGALEVRVTVKHRERPNVRGEARQRVMVADS